MSGQWETALGVAIFFELFWLDLFPAGTYIPPHGALTVFLSLTLGQLLGLTQPFQIFPAMVLSLPFAWLATRFEYWQRSLQNRSYNTLIHWARDDYESFKPHRLVVRSMLQTGLMQYALFVSAAMLLYVVLDELSPSKPFMPMSLEWFHLWALASIGGVLSLRIKRAYGLLGVGACGLGLLIWLIG